MVGVGVITSLLLGLDARASIAVVGVLMMVYVTFGGMVATASCSGRPAYRTS